VIACRGEAAAERGDRPDRSDRPDRPDQPDRRPAPRPAARAAHLPANCSGRGVRACSATRFSGMRETTRAAGAKQGWRRHAPGRASTEPLGRALVFAKPEAPAGQASQRFPFAFPGPPCYGTEVGGSARAARPVPSSGGRQSGIWGRHTIPVSSPGSFRTAAAGAAVRGAVGAQSSLHGDKPRGGGRQSRKRKAGRGAVGAQSSLHGHKARGGGRESGARRCRRPIIAPRGQAPWGREGKRGAAL